MSSFRGKASELVKAPPVRLLILVISGLLSLVALVSPISIRQTEYSIRIGEVAQEDIQAPRTMSFVSEVHTEQARLEAEHNVAPIFNAADPAIARKQIEKLRISLNYISAVRADTYANYQNKISDLKAVKDIRVNEDMANRILALSSERWETIQAEALNVLEQVMRNTIREDRVYDFQRNVPTLVSFSLSQDQVQIVSELVIPFVTPNSLYNEEQTQVSRQAARDSISPVTRKYIAGESIVQRGQIITPAIWESLSQFGLVSPQGYSENLAASTALVSLLCVLFYLFLTQTKSPILADSRSLLLISISFLAFLFASRLLIPNRTVLPYLFPVSALGMALASLFNIGLGMVITLLLSILAAYGLPYSLDLTLFYVLATFFGIFVLGKGRRIAHFFWAGVAIFGAGSAVILAYRLPGFVTDWIGIGTLIGAALFNGMASASLSLLLQFLLSQVLGKTTSMELLEISRPDHPLLQFILQNAPGTYQHSLMVANLGEQAAKAVGADALLIRVGSLHHDAGKALNPSFFIENQVHGNLNPHDDLDPILSSATIIRHVTDGVQLAQKYRLPPRIQDFIREHHGTLITRYQYSQAVKTAGGDSSQVNEDDFRYPGPRPQSRETGIIMLADGVEARARAELPRNDTEISSLVKSSFEFIKQSGQLDDTNLTLRDLNLIAESFVNTLRNTYHPRIKYPEIKLNQSATKISADASSQSITIPVSEKSEIDGPYR